jgi:hypothetical protein
MIPEEVELRLAEAEAYREEEAERLDNIRELIRIDSNGCWSDEDSKLEGFDSLTLDETRQCLADADEDFRGECGGWANY